MTGAGEIFLIVYMSAVAIGLVAWITRKEDVV